MDWTQSGIFNSFEFEAVNHSNSHLGWLDGILGGKITESYRGDYRSTCSLDYDGLTCNFDGILQDIALENIGIRIWHTATLGEESIRQPLGTFFQDKNDSHYELSRKTGTLNLFSSLFKMSKDYRCGNRSIPKGTNALTHFSNTVSYAFCKPYIDSGIKAYTTTKQRTWEAGTSSLSECHTIAGQVGGRVEPDVWGRVCLVPYTRPSKKAESFRLETGKNSTVLLGVDIQEPEIINRVIMSYTHTVDETSYDLFASAEVAKSHKWHPNKIGRWATLNYQMSEGDFENYSKAQMQSYMNNKVKSVLNENSSALEVYSVKTLYQPFNLGEVGRFLYADGGEPIWKKVLMSQREINIDSSMLMEITLEAINGYIE